MSSDNKGFAILEKSKYKSRKPPNNASIFNMDRNLGRVVTETAVADPRTRHVLRFRARFGGISLDSVD